VLAALAGAVSATAGCSISFSHGPGLRAWRVPNGAMEPTLRTGATVYTKPGHFHVRIGDIVIFHPPRGALAAGVGACGVRISSNELCSKPAGGRSSDFFIKRVVALGGQRIAIFGGHVMLDGKLQAEPFARASGCGLSQICNYLNAIVVPHGDAFMLGDNRSESDDSRFWGPVPLAWIVGIAETCTRSLKRCHPLS